MSDQICIGIDLGTTNSVLAYFNPETDSVEIIPNTLGERITPSTVILSDGEILVGNTAIESQTEDNPVISHVKRFIGQKQASCQDFLDNLEYEVNIDYRGYPMIPMEQQDGSVKKYKPEEISSYVLNYLKSCAEEHLGQEVHDAVVTVPAYFNEAQRRATKDACTIAGLNCLRLVAEPTAACLCYGLHKSEKETVLVFDLGGGTFDVSILKLRGGIFQVIATSGDTSLGGADFDQILLERIQDLYQEKTGTSPDNLPSNLNQSFAENIKKTLSNTKQTTIRLPNFKYVMTRAEFENLIHDCVEACMEPVDQVLQDADMTTGDISQIVLVGGSTRIPVIQQRLKEMFGPSVPLNKTVNPDEAVAYGAAVQATVLKNVGSKAKELLLLDVTPLSLGIQTKGGIMNQVIKRNSSLPCENHKMYSTVEDNQESVDIKVFQGERQFTKDCISLATFTLEGLPRRPRGVPRIKVTFKLDCDGLLEVSAVDKHTGLANQIEIKSESNLTPDEVENLVAEAEKFRAEDQAKRRAMEEVSRFEKYVYDVQRLLNLPENKELLGEELSPTNQYLMNTIEWIVTNRSADLETIQNCRTTVEFNLKPYLEKVYSHKQELEKSGIKVDSSEKQSENLEELIEDVCADLLHS